MKIRDIQLDWGTLEKITINQIGHYQAKEFMKEASKRSNLDTYDVYVCSDARNRGIRQILYQIPGVRVFSNAGNVIYAPNQRPSVVIGHCDENSNQCGAIQTVRNIQATQLEYPTITELVMPDSYANAMKQLGKVDKRYRAGIIINFHERGEVALMPSDEYSRAEIGMYIFKELEQSLIGRFTDEGMQRMAAGQNPELMLLTNVKLNLSVFPVFRVDFQRNSYHPILGESLKYSMSHALSGDCQSFKDTKTAIIALDINQRLPNRFLEIFKQADFLKNFTQKGGSIYIAGIGDLPSQKEVYRLNPAFKG